MKKILFAMALIALFAAGAAAAQEEIPETEIFGGYSLFKMGASNENFLTFQEGLYDGGGGWKAGSTSFFLKRGGTGSVAFNINEYFSIVTDIRYNQGNIIEGTFEFVSPETQTLVQTPFVIGIKNVSAMAGPRISFRKERGTAFFHALAGLDYWRLNGDFTIAGEKRSETGDKFGPGVAIGGGVDINVSEKFAVRVIQADYYLARQMERLTKNVNLSFGIVFRIGEKVLR
ncbi:MAG: outer membrane beta-barrel protein [Acidobacteriota bacterium]|jgi:opacity protein-like surface antigen|nr:outer membrane beta-barrel protein [Acidobacteriota bacterium]